MQQRTCIQLYKEYIKLSKRNTNKAKNAITNGQKI